MEGTGARGLMVGTMNGRSGGILMSWDQQYLHVLITDS